MPDALLTPQTVPVDAVMPSTPQRLVNFAAAYLVISGLSDLEGVVISSTQPDVSDQDKGWIKIDPTTGNPVSLNIFNGGWQPVPTVIPSGAAEPTNPQPYQLFYNTTTSVLEIYDGAEWTSRIWPSGSTANRPTGVPVGFIYEDTDIGQLLHYTSQGWSTVEGAVSEIKMLDGADVAAADVPTKWPGWVVHAASQGMFPINADTTHVAGTTGGRSTFSWSATDNSAQGGSRDTGVIQTISIDGTNAAGAAQDGGSQVTKTTNGTVDITPPWYGFIFIKKQY